MPIYRSGTRIAGRYEVVQGPAENPSLAGGMGLVYLCADQGENGRPVALKTFQPHLLSNRKARERFLREGTVWVELGKHPHIVRCYGVIQPGAPLEVYFVLELVAPAEGRASPACRAGAATDRANQSAVAITTWTLVKGKNPWSPFLSAFRRPGNWLPQRP